MYCLILSWRYGAVEDELVSFVTVELVTVLVELVVVVVVMVGMTELHVL
jgi:hypothetical protein